jgi:hypothetical protein
MPVIKTSAKKPEAHVHLDGDFALDSLDALRAHFKGAQHLKNPFPGDSWKILTRRHLKAHGLTPVDGAPESAESLNEQIIHDEHLTAKAALNTMAYAQGGHITSGSIQGSFLTSHAGHYEPGPEWQAEWKTDSPYSHQPPELPPAGFWTFSKGDMAWVHTQPSAPPGPDGWAHYHHAAKKPHDWPGLPQHSHGPEWSTDVWVTHCDIAGLEQAALAKAAAATKTTTGLKVLKGYHVNVLPAPGSKQAGVADGGIKAAVAQGHTIAATITVGCFGAKSPAEAVTGGKPASDCAFADHKEYKVVRDELVKAAKTLGVASPSSLSLPVLAASVATQVKAMDAQLDEVLAQPGIKPPEGTPAVKPDKGLIPHSLAPAPPEDGKGVSSNLNWGQAHALLKFAGELEHDEAVNVLSTAALQKAGWHEGGTHVISPDPNLWTVWFDPEPGDAGYVQVQKAAVVVHQSKELGTLVAAVDPETGSHLPGGKCRNTHQAQQALTEGGFSYAQAIGIMDTAVKKENISHALHVPAGNPKVTVLWNPVMGKFCMQWHSPGEKNPAYHPGDKTKYTHLAEHQVVSILAGSGMFSKNQALVIVLQAKGNGKHEVKTAQVRVTFSTVTGKFTVTLSPQPVVTATQGEPPMSQEAKDELLKQLSPEYQPPAPVPPSFDELLNDMAPASKAPAPKLPPDGPLGWNDKLTWTQAMFVLKNDSKSKFTHTGASGLLATAKAKPGKLVPTLKVQVMWCEGGTHSSPVSHYHVGWPQQDPPEKTLVKPKSHGPFAPEYGLAQDAAEHLLAQAKAMKGLWCAPGKPSAKVKYHAAQNHFHIIPDIA